MGKRIVMCTTTLCRDCETAKRFLAKRGVPYEEVDIDQHPLTYNRRRLQTGT